MAQAANQVLVLLLGGAVCVTAGVAVGTCWSAREHSAERLWIDPPASAPIANVVDGVPSFRNVVRAVGPAVVTVRAILTLPLERSERAASPEDGAAADEPARSGPFSVPTGRNLDSGTAARGLAAAAAAAPAAGRRDGSGFIVHPRGLVLTSRHVVIGAATIEVAVPQHGTLPAEMVGEDRATDLALLRLRGAPTELPALTLGDGSELQAGDWIVTVGDPFGLACTVTAGVVSFVGRHLPHSDFAVTNDFLQISAPVNPGNSGCPVFDVQGRVVGVTTQVAVAAQGISFAVPSRSVKWALSAMQRCPDGRVHRGYLGIEFSSRPGVDELGKAYAGAIIVRVAPGEPGERAGLRQGDIVLRVDDVPITDAKQLHERIVCSLPGSSLALMLLRDGQIHDPIVATLGEMGAAPGTALPN